MQQHCRWRNSIAWRAAARSTLVVAPGAEDAQETEGVLAWDDPQLDIDWGLWDVSPVLSEKDANAPSLADLNSPFTFDGV